MRVVADTNVVVSGLLWGGSPRQVLEAARAETGTLFTTRALLAELDDVLHRPKFARRLQQANVTAAELVEGYAALAHLIQAAQAEVIASGDTHLLRLGQYQGIHIRTAAEVVAMLTAVARARDEA